MLLTLVSLAGLSGVEAPPASASLPTWSVTASANDGTNTNGIESVDCPTEATCVAVGYVVNAAGIRRTLAEIRQGGAWSITPTANLGTRVTFAGVSCSSATSCVAVGSARNGIRLVTLIESWDGTSWSLTPSPNRGTTGNELTAVSCASATSCVAVGYYTDDVGVVRTLVETWQGTSWSLSTSPSPGPSNANLNAVSCATATSCVAVGSSVAFDGTSRTLVEKWDGTSWSAMTSPSPDPKSSVLIGVSCATATTCVAVGWAGDESFRHTLIETWRGIDWSVAASPNPSSTRAAYLRSVSCTTSARCIAVGFSVNGPTTRTVVEGWNGSVWSILASPNPGTLDSSLLGVSCASSTSCVAGGHRRSGIAASTLVLSGTASTDVTAPTVSVSTPIDGGYYVVGQNAAASYTCIDEIGGSGTQSCAGTVASGVPIDTSAAGAESFSVTGTDGSGNSSTTSSAYTVVQPMSASGSLPPGGGSVTTDSGAGPTPSAPIATTVTSVDAGTVSIDQGAVTRAQPSGFTLLGMQVNVGAPPASADSPLNLNFDVDAAMLPSGATKDNLSVLLDGALLSDCPGATAVPAGSSACVMDRTDAASGGGDARVTVVSVSGGQWNLAAGAAVPPRMSIANASVVEGDAGTTPMQFPVSLSAPSVLPVTVHYASADGSATAGSDYVATSGTLTFAPGEAQKLVPVAVKGDTQIEPLETFTVALSSPAGATISRPVGTGTILDDDATVPTAPLSPQAEAGNASMVLHWAAPTNAGGRPIGGYVVTPYVSGAPGTPRVFTTPATTETISGLANGTTYTFDVAATNEVGTGARSVRSAAITIGAPAAPTVSARGSSTQAVVTWSAPVNNGYGVTSYVVSVYQGGTLLSAKTHTVTCTQPCVPARSWTVTGLTNGAVYTFKVQAQNSQGTGPPGATTILVSATPAVPGKPAPPTAKASPGAVNVSWSAPFAGTATIDEYVIVVYENGAKSETTQLGPVPTTHLFTKLSPGVAYTFRVQALNDVGAGPLSGLSNPATPT
jgi:hypothetical protein